MSYVCFIIKCLSVKVWCWEGFVVPIRRHHFNNFSYLTALLHPIYSSKTHLLVSINRLQRDLCVLWQREKIQKLIQKSSNRNRLALLLHYSLQGVSHVKLSKGCLTNNKLLMWDFKALILFDLLGCKIIPDEIGCGTDTCERPARTCRELKHIPKATKTKSWDFQPDFSRIT